MANTQKRLKMNGNGANGDSLPLEEIKLILGKLLVKERVSEIMKVLPMSSYCTLNFNIEGL